MKKTKSTKSKKHNKNKFIKALTKIFINKYALLTVILCIMILASALIGVVNDHKIFYNVAKILDPILITIPSMLLLILLIWVIKNKKTINKKGKIKIALVLTILLFNILIVIASSIGLYVTSGVTTENLHRASKELALALPIIITSLISPALAFALLSLALIRYFIIKSKTKS